MASIDEMIKYVDKAICDNIDLLDSNGDNRGIVSQNILAQSRNLVEHIMEKIYESSNSIDDVPEKQLVHECMKFIKSDNKYSFLRRFHKLLQESKSHYSTSNDGAERLVLNYMGYYYQIRGFMKKEYQMDILHNIKKFPMDTDKSTQEYHEKIACKIKSDTWITDLDKQPRMYVYRKSAFIVGDDVYYEIILTPGYDTASKYDRFVCYSSIDVPAHYAIKASIIFDDIEIGGKTMPISILNDYEVSIRPCELNNFAKIFGEHIKIESSHMEYKGMMTYLSNSGTSLYEIATSSESEYDLIKQKMFDRSRKPRFKRILDLCRNLICKSKPGSNVVRYLLHTLNNKVIRSQLLDKPNRKLSNLYLEYGCIPFDKMPYATSLINHNPREIDLLECISTDNREHEILAKNIYNYTSSNSCLYVPMKELTVQIDKISDDVRNFNENVYINHPGRRIEIFGKNLYLKEAYDNTKIIIEKLVAAASIGTKGYSHAMASWLDENLNIDSDEKREILGEMFAKSHVSLIYGAAGTGKTYLINQISQFFDNQSKLYLANTNPAVDNLRRKVTAKQCSFMTIRKYLTSESKKLNNYDVLIIDECSMVSNRDMAEILVKTNYQLLILSGDTYQIEPIDFGNWFAMARYFVPRYAWHELQTPYRTSDKSLLRLWEKARNIDQDLTAHIVKGGFSSLLDESVFTKSSDDEIILCLNYDGFYGINSINKFLQCDNPNRPYRIGLWTFKVGDPILFNDSERFAPVLYNNLKGKIVNIVEDEYVNRLWISIEVDKTLTELDVAHLDLELEDCSEHGKSVVKFCIVENPEKGDNYDNIDESNIPFQVAYAVSIHKSQGLEFDSVKIIITRDVDDQITHNIFYTAITRARKHLKIYWSPESQQKIISSFHLANAKNDASIFSAQSKMKMYKQK